MNPSNSNNNDRKAKRVLTIYDKLRRGDVLNKKQSASDLGVDIRTIQRDLDEIRTYLADNFSEEEITYDYQAKGYIIECKKDKSISAVEIFAVIKILIESRGFCYQEMQGLVNSIFAIASKEEQKTIKSLMENEVFHFKPLTHNKPILKMIWDIGQCILRKEVIEVQFKKIDGQERKRIIYPLSITFSEFYFYLIAQIEEFENKEPAFFRLDRIIRFKLLGRKFTTDRFEDGELKKRVLFMHGGKCYRLKFAYKGQAIESVIDRFPMAKITNRDENIFIIETEVYGKGCLMWLLSQGENVELLEPKVLREELNSKITKIHKIYNGE